MKPREIKFRAWQLVLKRMWLPEELSTLPIKDFKRKDLIWMQFTGLKDRHGKEIYEGDIVKTNFPTLEGEEKEIIEKILGTTEQRNQKFYNGKIWKVCEWRRLSLLENSSYSGDLASLAQINLEIIGNIYENPELLNL